MAKSYNDDWGAHHVQFVWFLTDADGVKAAEFFRKAFDFEPDQVQQNRIPTPTSPFLGMASGQKDGRGHLVQIQPGRADLIITAQNPDEPEIGFGKLFDLQKVFTSTLERIEDRSPIDQDPFRLSIIATVVRPVPSYAEGAKEFFDSLGFDPKISNPTDLTFQINSRIKLGDIQANRIVQISVLGVQLVSMALSMGQSQPVIQQPSHTTTMQYAARRQFDFNTVPDGKLLERKRQVPIFQSIASEILRVSSTGKIAGLRS